jgi:hypothetical protein
MQEWLESTTFFPHPIWKTLTAEWTLRQHRYRRVFSTYCASVCHNCLYGGCCKPQFPRLIDLIAYNIQHGSFPQFVQISPTACPFLGSMGCTLLPGPIPGICYDFHCCPVLNNAPSEVRELLALLAEDADRVRRAFFVLWKNLNPSPPPQVANCWDTSIKSLLEL